MVRPMAWVERTVACPECKTERTTKAGTGTKVGCATCGVKFPAPPAEPVSQPGKLVDPGNSAPRVKRAKAAQTVVRQNARPRPKKASPKAEPVVTPATAPVGDAPAPGGAGPPPDPAKNPAGGDPVPVRSGRRGGLGYYQRLVRKAKAA
jgi:ribosomal protein L37AE/L43A